MVPPAAVEAARKAAHELLEASKAFKVAAPKAGKEMESNGPSGPAGPEQVQLEAHLQVLVQQYDALQAAVDACKLKKI